MFEEKTVPTVTTRNVLHGVYTIGCLQEVPKMKLVIIINSQCHRAFTRA